MQATLVNILGMANNTLREAPDSVAFLTMVEAPCLEISQTSDWIMFSSSDHLFRFNDRSAASEMMSLLQEYFADRSDAPKFTRDV